jgi:ribose 5-phosphate isomerase A
MAQPANDFTRVAEQALSYIQAGDVVGLGTGRAAAAFIDALGHSVAAGLRVRGVPTSVHSEEQATELGIPLVSLAEILAINVTVDGADEVDPKGNLIKGLGGALVREKIVAASSLRYVIVVGEEKLVPLLGSHGVLPIEVVPFSLTLCSRRLTELGLPSTLRLKDGKPFVSDNGNLILDAQIEPLEDPASLSHSIQMIPGVVGTGLFTGMAPTVLVQRGDSVDVLPTAGKA